MYPKNLRDSTLLRYFKRPSRYHGLLFLENMEHLHLLKNLLAFLQSQQGSTPRDTALPAYFVVTRFSTGNIFLAAKIQVGAPSNSELVSLRVVLLKQPMNSFAIGRTWKGGGYSTFCETSVAMGFYGDGNEFEKSLYNTVLIHTVPLSQDGCWLACNKLVAA